MGLMLLYIVDIVEIVCAMLWLLLTVRKVCVTLYIASPMVLWWGSLGRVAGQVSGGQTAWLLFTTPTSSTSITVCAVCLCVCVLCVLYLCVCVCGDHCVNESNGLRLGGSSLQEGLPRPPQRQMLGTLRSQ